MAGPYKNNMQENRIKSQFLYRIMDVILFWFFKKRRTRRKMCRYSEEWKKGMKKVVEVNQEYMLLELFT